jgi:hypothetical protein
MGSGSAKVESRPAEDRGYPILTSSLMEGRYVCCVLVVARPESGAFSSLTTDHCARATLSLARNKGVSRDWC